MQENEKKIRKQIIATLREYTYDKNGVIANGFIDDIIESVKANPLVAFVGEAVSSGGVLLAEITEAFPIKATHTKLGEINIYGVRVKSNYSKNTMYQIFLRGSEVWVYDYETKLSK